MSREIIPSKNAISFQKGMGLILIYGFLNDINYPNIKVGMVMIIRGGLGANESLLGKEPTYQPLLKKIKNRRGMA